MREYNVFTMLYGVNLKITAAPKHGEEQKWIISSLLQSAQQQKVLIRWSRGRRMMQPCFFNPSQGVSITKSCRWRLHWLIDGLSSFWSYGKTTTPWAAPGCILSVLSWSRQEIPGSECGDCWRRGPREVKKAHSPSSWFMATGWTPEELFLYFCMSNCVFDMWKCVLVNFVTAFESLPSIRTVAKYAYRFRGLCTQKQEKRTKLKLSEEQ